MLRHSCDSDAGYTRQLKGGKWAYFDGDKRITDRDEIDRLNALALPPAYTDAWFCKSPNGHVQATGKDAKGRKQYRYHSTLPGGCFQICGCGLAPPAQDPKRCPDLKRLTRRDP